MRNKNLMDNNLWKRAATGGVFVLVLTGSVYLGPYTFTGLFLVISLLVLAEFYSLAQKAGYRPRRWLGLILGALVFALNLAVFTGFLSPRVLTLQLPLILLLFVAELFSKKEHPFANVLFAAGGIFYIVLAFACFVALGFVSGSYDYQLPLGFLILLWLSDTRAYLAGSGFGRHRMLERISQKKTWEGFIGGLLLCCRHAAQLARLFPVMNDRKCTRMNYL